MNFTDEQLSAFLDGELNQSEMEHIRKELVRDDNLAERLEEIAFTNSLIISKYEDIDSRPLPQAVVDLLANNSHKSNQLLTALKSFLTKLKIRPLAPFIALATTTIAIIMVILPSTQLEKMDTRISSGQPLSSGPVPQNYELHSLLSNSPSSLARQFGAGSERQFNAILSFKNHSEQVITAGRC